MKRLATIILLLTFVVFAAGRAWPPGTPQRKAADHLPGDGR